VKIDHGTQGAVRDSSKQFSGEPAWGLPQAIFLCSVLPVGFACLIVYAMHHLRAWLRFGKFIAVAQRSSSSNSSPDKLHEIMLRRGILIFFSLWRQRSNSSTVMLLNKLLYKLGRRFGIAIMIVGIGQQPPFVFWLAAFIEQVHPLE
jgi:hypothetical protein